MDIDLINRLRSAFPNTCAQWEAADRIEELERQRDELRLGAFEFSMRGAKRAIERCISATGQHHRIDLYVSANQCAEDVVEFIAKTKDSKNGD